MKIKKELYYISLFSSAGVGCYGFKIEGFNCIATAEFIQRRLDVQKTNNKCKLDSAYIVDDLKTDTAKNKILAEIKKNKIKDLDVLIATPPCQGMSVANHKKNNEIKRNSLVVESIKLTKTILPKFFIFENVRTFLNTICTDIDGNNKKINEAINYNLGKDYIIHSEIINFKDYGNNSSRTRTLVIGARKDIKNIEPSSLMPDIQKNKTLRDVLGGFKSFKEMGEIDNNDIYHNFRPYKEHMTEWIKDIKEGQSAFENKDPLKIPHTIIDGKIVFNKNKNGDKYTRCYWDKVAPCIHTRNDILASQSTIHPKDNRVFSVRELMELMTIPKEFKWTNKNYDDLNKLNYKEKRKFLNKEEINIRQSIGEAVPTEIFRQIANKIKRNLFSEDLNIQKIKQIINKNNLKDISKLKVFIEENLNNYTYSNLSKIAELANSERLNNAAFYTNQDICFEILKDLPDKNYLKKNKITILEPSVGVGNFLPVIIEKYINVNNVNIDVFDIDKNSLDICKILLKKIYIPDNIKIKFINDDFLLHDFKKNKYDIVVGNPPFGKVLNKNLLGIYKKNIINNKTSNIFSFFIEKAINLGDFIALITPKSLLSAPEFNITRNDILSNFNIKKISDYGESGFKGVKIETISFILDLKSKKNNKNKILIDSYINQNIKEQLQSYITDKKLPYWILYRNEYFDKIANKLDLGIFDAYRDRFITKKITKNTGKIRVLKSRNIGDNKIIDIKGYDSFIDSIDGLSVSRFLNNKNAILFPNLSYNPRATFLPKNCIADGSVAILILKKEYIDNIKITDKKLCYFNTEEFIKFYKIARNNGTRSLNIDSNSVFFLGLLK